MWGYIYRALGQMTRRLRTFLLQNKNRYLSEMLFKISISVLAFRTSETEDVGYISQNDMS